MLSTLNSIPLKFLKKQMSNSWFYFVCLGRRGGEDGMGRQELCVLRLES